MKKKNKILSVTFARRIALMIVCMIGVAGTMHAQQQENVEIGNRTQWGVKAALNIASLDFDASNGKSESTKSVLGGAIGLTFTYAFNPNWRINSGIEMSMKGFSADETGGSRELTVHAAYIQVPVTCGYVINLGKWNFEPRLGAFVAYGVAGNYSVSGSDSKQTFSDELLNPIDVGVAFGFYADNGKMVFGIGGEFGLTETNGKNFSVSGGTVHTRNTFLSVGYLF
ncbi:porin family protein [Prevotella koreensis]|uniref:PorT family protein n=1 Tax=Prevotella koreensis TaxID=2490854 RepID=A0A432LM14_9BACT|nr:porin family protein [Prevotella koreensis]RUL59794.1 PorT family protein [Prevotella koreensis]